MQDPRDRRQWREPTDAERGDEKDDLKTHTIEILDKPCQTLTLQIWENGLICTPSKEVVELLVEPRRLPVEIMELL